MSKNCFWFRSTDDKITQDDTSNSGVNEMGTSKQDEQLGWNEFAVRN